MNQENIQDIYPLSPMQQGMLFHSLYAPETGAYSEQLSCSLKGELDIDAFKKAWQAVVDRHDMFRTAFVWEDLDEPLQVVHKQVELPFEVLDWRDKPRADQEKQFDRLLVEERRRGMELTEAPLLRIVIIRLSDREFRLIWNHHHLLLDGWGLPVILKEVFVFYEAFSKGQSLRLPPPRPYRDYIAWLQEQDTEKAKNFWKERLKGFIAPTPLPVDYLDGEKTGGYAKERFTFTTEESNRLDVLAKEHQITLNTLVQAAWALLLARYSGEEDIVFGSTVSGRPPELPGVETMLGLFINTLPVRIRIDPSKKVIDWLQEIQVMQAETRQYEYTPLVDIHKWSDVPNAQPLFESILVFENYPVGEALEQRESTLQLTDVRSFERTNYPLTLVGAPGKQLALDLAYETDKFSRDSILYMLQHLHNILISFTDQADAELARVSLLSEEERRKVIEEWNRSQKPYPQDKTIQEQFENTAAAQPEAPAVVYGEHSLSFKELNEQANQMAHFLRKQGVGPESIVALSFERSVEMIVAVMAVLKAGGAYLPIDSDYPQERIQYMIDDSGVSILLTRKKLSGRFPADKVNILSVDDAAEEIAAQPKKNPKNLNAMHNLAYVIYTSGSTGNPKGVLLEHRGVSNMLANTTRDFDLKPGKKMLQFSSFSFDGATAEIFSSLVSGATLYLVDRDTLLSTDKFADFINTNGITTTTTPPSLLAQLPADKIKSFDTIVSVGDVCSWELAKRWMDKCRFINGYGPTEGTIAATWHQVEKHLPGTRTVPIGRPIGNVNIYLLDEQLNPVPVGVPGELYIGGPGVARGYYRRPELTAENFIPDPFSGSEGNRLYKTGDKARWLPDGNIEFLGRIDFQVKLRGFRVELGEIEARLTEIDNIEEAVVIAREDTPGDKRLVAYVDTQDHNEIDSKQVREILRSQLPDYMLPAAIVVLKEFPLSPNGKINRRALPPPEQANMLGEDEYLAPRNQQEELIASIWADVLGLDKVGVKSSFFDLGGHSLLATQVISRLRDAFDVDLELRHLFDKPTVEQVALEIERIRKQESGISAPPIEPVPRNQDLPLSFAQQRLWFLDQLAPGNPSYNIPSAMRLRGNLNIDALEKAIKEIIRRHESLRTTFKDVAGKPVQVISEDINFKLEQLDISHFPEEDRQAEALRLAKAEAATPFDLANGPLIRARLIKLADDDYAMLFNMHHIISDGWSVGILVSEVVRLYSAFCEDKPSPLSDLEIQYADFAHWQRNWLDGEVLQKQILFWKEELSGAPPLLELPTDRPRPPVQTSNGAQEAVQLDASLTAAIRKLSQEEGATTFMILLAAFQTLLHRYSGQDQILVGSPIANRTNSKVEKLIGFFVNTLIMKSDFADNPSFSDLLAQVRERSLNAFAHQDLPFEKLVEELQPERDMSHTPLFQVAFVLQNAPPQQMIELPDLSMQAMESGVTTAKYDLTLTMMEAGEQIVGSMEYNTDLFDRETIQRMLEHFKLLLQVMIDNPEREVGSFPLLSEKEKYLTLEEWNESARPFPDTVCVHQRFEEWVAQQPEAPAAVYRADAAAQPAQLSYAELNARANKLARHLQEAGVGLESIVGICMDRSLDMIVSMLAILKAGGAYVPIDPTYPDERIQYMVQDSELSVLLTQEIFKERLGILQKTLIAVDSDWPEIEKKSDDNLQLAMHPDNLAYVIYTSGSTGRPKGTLLHHGGACNLADSQQKAFNVTAQSRILQFASLSFDAATWEFVMALLNGAAIILTSTESITAGDALLDLLAAEKVTTITLPPSVLAVWPEKELPDLKTIITAGEAVSGELVTQWGKNRQFVNAYGPTESTVCASMHECHGSYPQGPPIGKPIGNFQLYILDSYMQPAAIGVPGELCIGGVGLARGYHNRPALTAEKFIPNPFSKEYGARLYRTGDLARYLPDGNIEFLGRIDFQVKVRGFRIELGEIEAVLIGHEQVKDVAVIAREDQPGNKRLTAYLVKTGEDQPEVNDLRDYLRERLPDYMVPAAFVYLDELPLTPNGKLDRKALPAPEFSRDSLSSEYVAPRNEPEEQLVGIVKELLELDKVGVYDNFFELGGHSLLATQFMSRLRETFEVELPLRTLFERPTVAEIGEAVEKAKRDEQKTAQMPQIKRVSRERRTVRRSDLGS